MRLPERGEWKREYGDGVFGDFFLRDMTNWRILNGDVRQMLATLEAAELWAAS